MSSRGPSSSDAPTERPLMWPLGDLHDRGVRGPQIVEHDLAGGAEHGRDRAHHRAKHAQGRVGADSELRPLRLHGRASVGLMKLLVGSQQKLWKPGKDPAPARRVKADQPRSAASLLAASNPWMRWLPLTVTGVPEK